MMTFKNRWIRAAIALPTLALLSGCSRHHGPATHNAAPALPAASVRVQKTELKSFPVYEDVMGTVRSRLQAKVEAKVSGRIVELPVRLGQQVRAGDLLVRLEAAEVQARHEQATASLQQAEREWNRVKKLVEQQAATRAELDAVEGRYLVAKGALAEANAMQDYVKVVAPFTGVITRKWADVGDLAAPGKPLLSIEDATALQLEADVPEAIAGGIKSGSKLQVRVDGQVNSAFGTVEEIAPSADPLSRTLQVKLDLPSDAGFRPGQFARLLVATGEAKAMRVPASAVVRRGQLEMVFTVATNTARMHLVKTGRRLGEGFEIVSGLDPVDTIVVEGAQQLADNQPVTLK